MIKKVTKSKQIRDYVAANPKAKSAEIAEAIGVTPAYVATVMWTAKKKAEVVKKKPKLSLPKPNWKQLGLFSSDVPMVKDKEPSLAELNRISALTYAVSMSKAKARMEGDRGDPVNNPAHYKVGGIETIDFIEAKQLGYNLGNVIKYLTRADYKGNKLEDLRKAQWYLTREINTLK
jgi:hypothetical protein